MRYLSLSYIYLDLMWSSCTNPTVERQKNMVMNSAGPETKNDCTIEDQQQFARTGPNLTSNQTLMMETEMVLEMSVIFNQLIRLIAREEFINLSRHQSFKSLYTVTILSDYRRGIGLVIGFIDHLRIVTTSNYNSLTELRTPNITVTTAHIKYSLSSLDVSW
jgi:hypothetical protein